MASVPDEHATAAAAFVRVIEPGALHERSAMFHMLDAAYALCCAAPDLVTPACDGFPA